MNPSWGDALRTLAIAHLTAAILLAASAPFGWAFLRLPSPLAALLGAVWLVAFAVAWIKVQWWLERSLRRGE